MSHDEDSIDEDDWDEDLDEAEEVFPCPDCQADVYIEADVCPSCGYWFTDADRQAAWADDSASQRIRTIGWWVIGIALVGVLCLWRF